MDDIKELDDKIHATAKELLATAFDGFSTTRGLDSGTSLFVIEAVKAALAKGADHVFLAEQLIFKLIDIIETSDCMNYPTIGEDIGKDIASGLKFGPVTRSNVVRLH